MTSPHQSVKPEEKNSGHRIAKFWRGKAQVKNLGKWKSVLGRQITNGEKGNLEKEEPNLSK